MPQDTVRCEIHREEKTRPDGTCTCFYHLYQVMIVDGVEKLHRYADKSFTSEKNAQLWIKQNWPTLSNKIRTVI